MGAFLFWIGSWGLAGFIVAVLNETGYEGWFWAIPIVLFCIGGLPLYDKLG